MSKLRKSPVFFCRLGAEGGNFPSWEVFMG